MVSHRSGVSNDTWGSLWRGSPSWSRLLAAPQPTGAGDHSPSRLRPSPGCPELLTGRELPQAGHPPTHPTLPWAIPLDPSEAHVGRYPLNTPKGERQKKERIRKAGDREQGRESETYTHPCSRCSGSTRKVRGIGGGEGRGRKRRWRQSRFTRPQGPGPSLGAQQQAAPKSS